MAPGGRERRVTGLQGAGSTGRSDVDVLVPRAKSDGLMSSHKL